MRCDTCIGSNRFKNLGLLGCADASPMGQGSLHHDVPKLMSLIKVPSTHRKLAFWYSGCSFTTRMGLPAGLARVRNQYCGNGRLMNQQPARFRAGRELLVKPTSSYHSPINEYHDRRRQ